MFINEELLIKIDNTNSCLLYLKDSGSGYIDRFVEILSRILKRGGKKRLCLHMGILAEDLGH